VTVPWKRFGFAGAPAAGVTTVLGAVPPFAVENLLRRDALLHATASIMTALRSAIAFAG
jgi:hypothetical protein